MHVSGFRCEYLFQRGGHYVIENPSSSLVFRYKSVQAFRLQSFSPARSIKCLTPDKYYSLSFIGVNLASSSGFRCSSVDFYTCLSKCVLFYKQVLVLSSHYWG